MALPTNFMINGILQKMSRINIKVLIYIWFMLCMLSLNGQNTAYQFKQISYEQGLPGVNVRKQFQDRDGIMWISLE
jgi:hypothetical protein